MRKSIPRASRRFLRDTRGATVTEYAIILFLVAVVAASGFRVFGSKLQNGMGRAKGNLEVQGDTTAQTTPAGGGGGGGGAAAGGGGGGNAGVNAAHPTRTQEGFGGPREQITAREGSSFPKFAMVAIGIIVAVAAFVAAMKAKNASV